MKQFCRLLFLLLITINATAQTGSDSTTAADTVPMEAPVKDTAVRIKKVAAPRSITPHRDTISRKADTLSGVAAVLPDSHAIPEASPIRKKIRGDSYQSTILKNPWYNWKAAPMVQMVIRRDDVGRESQFYLLCGLVLFFALIRTLFGKYLQNLFAVFFRVSMKQKQLREQLLQMPLPSLLLNLLFIFTGGIYTAYLMRYYGIFGQVNQWLLILYCAAALAIVYLGKLMVLKLTGWIFNMSGGTDTYIFVVFLVNKLLGIFLLPMILFIAFSDPAVVSVVITLSYIMIFVFFLYRYLISYGAVRKEIKVSPFHFFLYLCAFELIPLVLIYKVLLEFVYRSP